MSINGLNLQVNTNEDEKHIVLNDDLWNEYRWKEMQPRGVYKTVKL